MSTSVSALRPVWEVLERYDSLSPEEKIGAWAGMALGMADTVHHYIHGKKKGATMFDCTDESCRLMVEFRRKAP